jgi:DnaJ-class molecular chaperone
MIGTSQAQPETQMCRCCSGLGMQRRSDGINVRCPACGGTGIWRVPERPHRIDITCKGEEGDCECT